MIYKCSIVDDCLDGEAFELDISVPNRIMVKHHESLAGAAPFDVVSIRAWHLHNYQHVVDHCSRFGIKLTHVYDNVRGAWTDMHDPWFLGGHSTNHQVVELATVDDAMLFRLSWL